MQVVPNIYSENNEIKEIMNELFSEGEYVNDSTLYKSKSFNNECFFSWG